MEEQTCPKCGSRFSTSDGWAKSAVSLLVQAPAVRDMATQVRCPHCQHLFSDGEVRYLDASRFKVSRVLILLVCLGLVVWVVSKLF